MNRYERILHVPSIVVTKEVAEKVGELIHSLAQQRVDAEMRERLRNIFRANQAAAFGLDPVAASEDAFVQGNYQNETLRSFIAPAFAEKYTFISPRGNVQFVGDDWSLDDIPKDIDVVIARADGPSGNFIEIRLNARFANYNDLVDQNNNRMIVQGDDARWVNDVYERIRQAVEPQRKAVRSIVYNYMVAWNWLTFALVVFLEYKVVRIVLPAFGFNSSLSPLAVLSMFVVLFVNLILVANFFIKVVGFLYPHFEFEANLSQSRTDYRKPIALGIAALYCAAIVALFKL
jgi:hypothetical protein